MVFASLFSTPRGLRLGLVGVLMLCGIGAAQAQNRVGRPGLLDPAQANPLLQLQRNVLESTLESGLVALEGAVDPAEYVVGPGDRFVIVVSGLMATNQVIPVSAAGDLVLPEAGEVQAAGRTLDAVQRDAKAALRERFQNVPIEVSLMQPRLFYVHISGAVPEPGRYLMLPIARVDDALQQAYASRAVERPDPQADGAPRIVTSATSERPAINDAYRPAFRNVRITHRDSTTETIDLIRYYTTGDTNDNPYLRDGDVVTVPSYHQQRDGIRVSGEVAYPGTFDPRPDDTILDLLLLTAGPTGVDTSMEVHLTRRLPDGQAQTRTLDLNALYAGEDVPVQGGDHINVVAEEYAEAAIYGLVHYPGTYPIQDGVTTLQELVEMAGGLEPEADPSAAFLERRKSLAFKEEGTISDLDFFSRTFLRSSSDANRLVASLEAALQPGGPDIVLYDQDRIVFPRDEGTVFVTGNVPQPGYVEYVEGQPARYYVEQAGGEGPLTTSIYVFEDGTGKMHTGDDALVRSGDTIFVNREAIAESPQIAQLLISAENSQRQARIMTTQTIITGVTAAISVIATLKSFGAFD